MAALLRRLEQRRRSGTPLLQQRRFIRLGSLQVTELDMAKAADFFRNGGKSHRDVVVNRIKLRQHLFKHGLVIAHERPLGLALGRITERIERGPAQEFQFRNQLENRKDPRAERNLLRLAGEFISPHEKRRRKVYGQAQIVVAKLAAHLLEE